MKYETIKFNVGSEQYDVIHCLGDGQCECKSCKDKNKWSIAWTSWFYKLNETDEHVLCRDCLMEVLIQRRIEKAIKDRVEQGYIKIPEGAVVLTREELKEKINCCDVSMIHHDDDGKRYIEYEKYEDFTDRLGKRIQQLKGQLKQERKETAEKFAEGLKEEYAVLDDECRVSIRAFRRDIDKVCKKITESGNMKVSPKELRSVCNYYEYGCEECSAKAICHIKDKKSTGGNEHHD